MYIHVPIIIRPILALAAGAVLLIAPRLERFAVAAYLIAIGVLGLMGR